MFNAIDDSARNVASKLSNWVLNLPFWPEGSVGERLLRYILLGLLAADQVLIFISNWSLPGIAVISAIFGVAAIAVYADILRAIYKNQPWRMATYIDVRLMWLFIGIIHVWWMLVFVVQGYFEFHGSMFTWWLMYELEDVKPPRKKKTSKGQRMATILWTTAQYSDRPVELSATQLVITQAKCAGGDSSAPMRA